MSGKRTWVDEKGTWQVVFDKDAQGWILRRYHPEQERWTQLGYFRTRAAAIEAAKDEE